MPFLRRKKMRCAVDEARLAWEPFPLALCKHAELASRVKKKPPLPFRAEAAVFRSYLLFHLDALGVAVVAVASC